MFLDLIGADKLLQCILQAEKEPILSSFLYASILSHACLEQALGFVLANRLQNPTLLATQLMDIFSNVMMHDTDIQRSIRLDVQVLTLIYRIHCLTSYCMGFNVTTHPLPQAFKDRDPACLSYNSALLYLKVMCFGLNFSKLLFWHHI